MTDETNPSPPKSTEPAADDNRELPRIPPLKRWDNVMDELIEEAIRNGEFDNLKGKGKPLNLNKNPYGQETELAYSLLKNNDYTLPWIATRNEIFGQIEAFRAELKETFGIYSAEFRMSKDELARSALKVGWRHYLNNEVENAIQALNRKIGDANLKQPREVVEILKLNLKRELERAGAVERLEDVS